MLSLNDKIFHKDAVDPKTVTMHLNALVKTAKALLNVALKLILTLKIAELQAFKTKCWKK